MYLFICKVYRSSIIKYLRQYTNNVNRRSKKIMNGLLYKFSLENSEEFFNNYKVNNTLAQEASTALNQFILSLNEFFDLYEDLSKEMLMGNTEVSWYGYANVESSDDYIRAKSIYYNELSFSDVSINMI